MKIAIDKNDNGWYCSREKEPAEYELELGDWSEHMYLHKDGVWRTTTQHNGELSGYFGSIQEIRDIVKSLGYDISEEI